MDRALRLDEAFVKNVLPKRPENAHKGDFGTLSVIGGSAMYRGAAILSCAGAYGAGCGIVRLCAPELVCAAAAAVLPSVVLLPCGSEDEWAHGAIDNKHSAVLFGPGLGNSEHAAKMLEMVLDNINVPLVIDADGINVLGGHLSSGYDEDIRNANLQKLKNTAYPVVLTPHLGEMARLCAVSIEEAVERQVELAVEFAKEFSCVVALKGHVTVVAAKNRFYVNSKRENSGLAKGGSGDVLSGIIAGLIAGGMNTEHASAAAVWLHSEAGMRAARDKSTYSMMPMDIVDYLGKVFLDLGF